MRIPWPRLPLGRERRLRFGGGAASVAIAIAIYSQFDVHGWLGRDAALYTYAGQQMAHGVPPYVSAMDPKGPLTPMLSGFGAMVARWLGLYDLTVIRLEFFVITVLTVLAVYLLVLELWHSVVAALTAAAVFATFLGFARDGLEGPNAHTPATLLLTVAMWLTLRRQWYLAGFAASLAFLDWQPMFPYGVIVIVCAAVWSAGNRLRSVAWSLAGGVTPLAAVMIYYAAEGHLRSLFDGLIVFPLTDVRRDKLTFANQVRLIFDNVNEHYGASAYLIWLGLSLMLVTIVWVLAPRDQRRRHLSSGLVLVVGVTFAAQLTYALYDYQSYGHAYPLLPYSALGFGAGTSYVLRRSARPRTHRGVTAGLLVAVVAMTVGFAVDYASYGSGGQGPLRAEQASACILRRVSAGTPLWSLGNPAALVLLHRRNPDGYPVLDAGVDTWRIEHTVGGFPGWTTQIKDSRAAVLVVDIWQGPVADEMEQWLSSNGYRRGYVGYWQVFVTAQASTRMSGEGLELAKARHIWPLTSSGRPLRRMICARS